MVWSHKYKYIIIIIFAENELYSKVFLLENTCKDKEINLPHPVGDVVLFHELKVSYSIIVY